MTNFTRSQSTGTTRFPDVKTTQPGLDIYENIHHDDYDYEEEHSTTSTDYYDVSTPLSSHGSRSGPGSGQYTILDIFAAVLKKSLVMSCTMERGGDDAAASMDIGWPTEVKHVSHVTFDRFSGFLGLPSDLEPEVPPQAPSARSVNYYLLPKKIRIKYFQFNYMRFSLRY